MRTIEEGQRYRKDFDERLQRIGRQPSDLKVLPGVLPIVAKSRDEAEFGRLEELALHPTVKPVAMIVDAIKDVSCRGGIVLDLFGGSGSTLIAAHKTGRRARVCELDPVYCDRILHRWETFAKDDAELIGCGLARIRSAASDGDETCEIPATGAPQAPRPKDRIAPNRTPPWKAPASCSGASSRRARSQPIDPIAQ